MTKNTITLGIMKFLAITSLVGGMSCQNKGSSKESNVNSDWLPDSKWETTEASKEQRPFVIDWKCAVRTSGSSGYLRDEYCEWDRAKADVGGSFQCDFRTNFVSTSHDFYIPKYQGENSEEALYALVDECLEFKGAHCYSASKAKSLGLNPGDQVGCDYERDSDPQICTQLQRLRYEENREVGFIKQAYLGHSSGKQGPQIQLSLLGSLPSVCAFDLDPKLKQTYVDQGYTAEQIQALAETDRTYVRCNVTRETEASYASCDEVAKEIRAGVQINVTRETRAEVENTNDEVEVENNSIRN